MSVRTIIAVALLLASIVLAVIAFALGLSDLASADYVLAWMVFGLVGEVLAIRRAKNPIGWLFLVIGVVGEGSIVAGNGPVDPAGGAPSILRLIASESWVVPYGLLAVLLILFPTGRPPTRRWWLPIVAAAVIIPFGILNSTDEAGTSIVSIVFGAGAARIPGSPEIVTAGGILGLFLAAAASLFQRRRSASTVERQQLKWVGFAGALLATALVGTAVAFFFTSLRELDPEAKNPSTLFGGIPFVTGLSAVPIAVSVAVLRHRLYEIDALVSRTLVYGSLTAILALAYLVGVAAFQFLLSPFTSGSPIAVAVSTLAVVALFQPLRRGIRSAVDRRFYRTRYDAVRALYEFGLRLNDEVDLEAVRADLLDTVYETMQPAHAGVWLREPTRSAR